MEQRILVAYASNAGSTAEIAKVVGEELGRGGAAVDVQPVGELDSANLSAYSAIVVGAPMILGWHREAARFVAANRTTLAVVPCAFFITALSLTRTGDPLPAGLDVFIDPKLGKSPANARRLALKERYATVNNYLRPIAKHADRIKPLSVGLFGGKLDFGRLKLLQMLFIMLLVGAQPGDYRNWDAIRSWARQLSEKLGG